MVTRRSLLVAFLLLAGFSALAPGNSAGAAAAPRTCFGQPATQVMTRSTGIAYLTPGDDVIVGSSGPDQIVTSDPSQVGGVDLICGNGGDDVIGVVAGEGSKVDAGSGRDFIIVVDGADATGGSGNDKLLLGCGAGTVVDGGAGNDAATSEAEADATAPLFQVIGSGQYPCIPFDLGAWNGEYVLIVNTFVPQIISVTGVIEVPSVWVFNGATGRGGSGNDGLLSFGSVTLKGDSGSDVITGFALDPFGSGLPSIDCGSGVDTALASDGSAIRRCETVYS